MSVDDLDQYGVRFRFPFGLPLPRSNASVSSLIAILFSPTKKPS